MAKSTSAQTNSPSNPTSPGHEAILEESVRVAIAPRVQTMDAVAHARAPTTRRSCPVARPNGSRQWGSRWFGSPATGFDLPESTLWMPCEARIQPDDSFINLVPFRVQARDVNVW